MRVLAITGGHRVDLPAFTGMLGDICAERGWVFASAEHPIAQRWLRLSERGTFDAILCHDVPGLVLERGTPPTPRGPDPEVAEALSALLEAGQGLVFLHHALAGWPGWPGWADVLGGRYHYAPGDLHGHRWPDSGFRYASYTARVADPRHPVCAGLADFELRDELYCCPVFEEDVVPLVRADAPPGEFRGTLAEVLGTTPTQWHHPPPSDLIAWAKVAGRSPLVYIQPGDGPDAFALAPFRRLLANGLAWVASQAAHDWARRSPTAVIRPPTPSHAQLPA